MNQWGRIVEDQIRDALDRRVFDNLPGKGKPIDLSAGPFEHPLAGTFRRILRDSGSSHPAIEARRALENELNEAREQLRRAWTGYCRFGSEPAWRQARDAFCSRVKELNRAVRLHNLKAPAPPFHLHVVDCEAEIQAATGGTVY